MKNFEKVTAVIKAKNEEHQIAEAIKSAFLISDEVIVVDDKSTDRTASIALAHGARVIEGCEHFGEIDKLDYLGFSQVEEGWILRLDADERVTAELAQQLSEVVNSQKFEGARFARLHVMFGAPVYGGGWFKPFQLGFFSARSWDRSWDAKLHSQVPVTGNIFTIKNSSAHTIHYDYDSISTFIKRSLLTYAETEAKQKFSQGGRFKYRNILLDPWIKLFGRFIIRKGFRDGSRGLVLAALLAAYEVSVACFLWQLKEVDGNNRHA